MISVRQPVSCEPCRHRKIKCNRTRPTCDTCRRRGCVDRCIYRNTRESDFNSASNPSNEELLNRISNLEELLRKHTGAVISGRDSQDFMTSIPSPPVDHGHPPQLSPESFISEGSSRRTCALESQFSRNQGILTSTSSGDVRYEPQSSQWTSVLANTNLSIETPSLDDQEESGLTWGFPFMTSEVSSIEELLSLLPPMQQCDYLKNQYFIRES
jgi:hypothetical protein